MSAMDYRESHDSSTQTPSQQSPDDVLRWLDSLSGHAEGPAPSSYDLTMNQWLPDPASAPYVQQSPATSPYVQPNAATTAYTQHNPATAPYTQPDPAMTPYAQPNALEFQQGSSSSAAAYQQMMMSVPAPQPLEAYGGYDEQGHNGSSRGSTPSYTETESVGSSTRGGKPRIALDPSQPLTVDGKPRARVYVACDRWYDPAPKRRGQDKAPRTRSAVGHRKPQKPAVKKGQQGAGGSSDPGDRQGRLSLP
ncbi:hypothetical protein BD414DRAFT_510665 [Trametes punicea]|nr:hypothetical protein BD414DRAFT_510665 [Trametes punicea]